MYLKVGKMNEKKLKKIIRYLILFCSINLFLIGYLTNSFNVMFISIISLFANNVLYAIESLKTKVVFLLFNISFFTFLLGKYFLEMLSGIQWWNEFPNEIIIHTLLSLFISLLFIYTGSVFAELFNRNYSTYTFYDNTNSLFYFRKVSKIIFYITYFISFVVLLERIMFVLQNGYISLYLNFHSKMPFIIKKVSESYLTFFYIYLATLPEKREAKPLILLQIIYLGVSVLTGVRGILVVGLLVIVIYYIFRDLFIGDYDEKWLGKVERTLIIIALPFLIAFLNIYSFIRVGIKVDNFSLLNEINNFFVLQGGSVNVISYGKLYENFLPLTNTSYALGPFINYFTIGTIASIFTGLSPIVDKIDVALYGNNFGATITYLVNPSYYLAGGGLGTQYIAELYADFGYLGVAIFNFIIGIVLSLILSVTSRKWWLFAIGLLTCNAIIEMPRNFAFTWIGVWYALPTWFPILITWVFAKFIKETRYRYEKLR